jgi:hypothetical protein
MVLAGAPATWASERHLTVCMPLSPELDFKTVITAQGYATRIYSAIGVNLRWKGSCTEAELSAPGMITLGVEWAAKAPVAASPMAQAVAYPLRSSGTRITLYKDRLSSLIQRNPIFAAPVLGHVLAHEIGHVLLRSSQHSSEGLMKSFWCAQEQSDMRRRFLRFTESETAQILHNLELARECPGCLVS